MNKYLLTIFAEVEDTKFVEKLGKGLSPIVDSPHLKFQHSRGAIIFHFESEVSHIEVLDFISGLFYGLAETYILTELTDKTSVVMPEDMKAHLLNLSGETEINNSFFDSEPKDFDYEEMAEEFIESLLYEFNEEVKLPTLNEILDKILDKGIDSLTQLEKQKLDEYSKN
jgi:hypothetical protein